MGKGHVVKKVDYQNETSNKAKDVLYKAMESGKRISESGKAYYEYRANRSDLNPKKRL